MVKRRRSFGQLQEQLVTVKRKLRQEKKVSLVLPSEFTFNRDGVKHFDQVTSWFQWGLKDVPVEIDFRRCSSANYQALSLLVLYCWHLKQQKCTVSFLYDDEGNLNGSRVWRMLGASALFSVATDPKLNFPSNEHKPLFAIRNADDFKAALECVDAFTQDYGVEYEATLRYVVSELLYNVLDHGASDFFWRGRRYPAPAVLQFAWYEKINEIHFIVADTGVGIKKHLEQAYPGLESDVEAIRLAVQPEVSGTFGAHDPYSGRNNAGMGLFLSSNIARKLRGDMYIGSGSGVLHISPADTTSRSVSGEWPGTFVLLTVRLDRGTEFALETIMDELRERARTEVDARNQARNKAQFLVSVYNYFGKRADIKSEAITFRDRHLFPAVREGKVIILDFSEVTSSTHSFLNALLASPIRTLGLLAYKRIRAVNATSEIQKTIQYILDDNTED